MSRGCTLGLFGSRMVDLWAAARIPYGNRLRVTEVVDDVTSAALPARQEAERIDAERFLHAVRSREP